MLLSLNEHCQSNNAYIPAADIANGQVLTSGRVQKRGEHKQLNVCLHEVSPLIDSLMKSIGIVLRLRHKGLGRKP